MITINMPKARQIKREMLRAERQPRLANLDVEFQRALENEDTEKLADVKVLKQQLRDITKHPALDNTSSPEQLAELTLDVLLRLDQSGAV